VLPSRFASGATALDNPELATFAAFGSFVMLLLVDLREPVVDRVPDLATLATLAAVGACFVTLGTLDAPAGIESGTDLSVQSEC
jgi:xanthine/uracil/vitamin C permease (AzgA family)